MAVTLCFGSLTLAPEADGYLLDTDIGHPLLGAPGVVSLFLDRSLVSAKFLGYSSPKFCIPRYLTAVADLLQEYRELAKGRNLLVRCHSWTSGTGKVLLADVIRLAQPSRITEYHCGEPMAGTLSATTTTFLPTQYPFPGKVAIAAVHIDSKKINDYKDLRNQQVLKCISRSGKVTTEEPWLGQIERLTIYVNGSVGTADTLYSAVGKICGLSQIGQRCAGLGLIRDVNLETGLVWILSEVKDMESVECIELACGDGGLEVDWAPASLSAPFFSRCAVNTQRRQKFHPTRSYAGT